MVEVEQHSSLPNRLDSVDSGISDELGSASSLSPNWCPSFSPITMPKLVDQLSFFSEREGGSCSSSDVVCEIASQLADDLVFSVTDLETRKPANRHCRTLRRLWNDLSSKHEILFASLIQQLNLTDKDLDCQFLENVADRMFSDEQFNWGRIVAFYSFAGCLARHCVENHMNRQWPEKIASKTGRYIAEKATTWIMKHGGWDGMEEFFKEQDNTESKIWKGLLYTVLGLGALATTMAVVH